MEDKMKTIPLANSDMVVMVDDCDFERLSQYKWTRKKNKYNFYAERYSYIDGRQVFISMHREILGLDRGDKRKGDHKNMNGLDNQRCNLRVATNSLNSRNSRIRSSNKSGYRGVSWDKLSRKWKTQITVNWKVKHVGTYDNIENAAMAYDTACIKYLGNDAVLNFPLKQTEPVKTKTMNDYYHDGTGHLMCSKCGFCKPCGDCKRYGCG
jgi:hypothetical protein